MWQTVANLTPTECTSLEDLFERRASLVNLSKMLDNTALEASHFIDVDPATVVAQANKAQEQIREWWSRTLQDHGFSRDNEMVYRADLQNREIYRFVDTGAVGQSADERR